MLDYQKKKKVTMPKDHSHKIFPNLKFRFFATVEANLCLAALFLVEHFNHKIAK